MLQATSVLLTMWLPLAAHAAATKSPREAHCPGQVRRRAYLALAGYPLEELEEVGVLRPLRAYAAPLLREGDAHTRSAAGALADAALAYEHANRRRCAAHVI